MVNDKVFLSLERILARLLLVSAGLAIAIVVYVIASRVQYPYSVERMEGASLLQVMRILNGQKLYVQPSIEYTALIYPPIYFYISALASRIMGLGFAPLRLVSSAAFVGCLIIIFLMVKNATRDKYSAFIGSGFFAVTYPLSGVWFDVARVDSLFVFFCLLAVWYSTRDDSRGVLFSSLFWILAIFTKQTALIAAVCSFAYLLIRNFQISIRRLAMTGLFAVIAYVVCTFLCGKWFSYFMFYLPTFHHSQDSFAEISASLAQLLVPPFFAILIGLFLFLADRNMRARQEPIHYYAFMTCVLFGLAFIGRLNLGGFTNVYMPAHVMTAVMLGIGLSWWKKRPAGDTTRSFLLLRSAVYLICTLQFMTLYFDPRLVIPTAAQENTWSRFKDFIAAQKGNILMPELNYLPALVDKPCFVNQVAVSEIFGEYGDAEPIQSNLLRAEINRVMQEQRFSLILLKACDGPWEAIANDYECQPLSETVKSEGFPPVLVNEYQACYPVDSDPESPDLFE